MTQRFGIRLEIEADSADAARAKVEALGGSVKRINGLRVDDVQRSFQALEARLDPAAKAARNLTRDTEALNKALAAGAVGQDRYTQLLARAKEAHDRLATGQRAVIQNTGATAQQLAQLQPQLNDIFTQLSTGTSVFTVLAQQGPQITQIFGGLGNTIRAIPGPLLAVAAAAAAVGGTFALWDRHTESIREMDRVNRLMGNGLGLTRDGLDALATSAAAAGNVSVNAARGMVTEFTKAGKISADTMTRLVGLSRDYAAATGQDAADASKELATLFRDPAKGATELADKIGLLNAAQLQHIKTLSDAGRASEAQGVLVDALSRRIAGAAEQTSIWARAWNAVSNAASGAADSAGKAIDRAVNGPTLEQRIAAAKQAVERARSVAQEDAALGSADKSWKPGQSIGEASAPAAQRDDVAAAERAYTDLLVQKMERDRRARAQAKARADADASRAAEDVARGLNPVGVALEDVNGKIARLEKGLGTGLTTGAANGTAALEALKNQAADYTRVAATGLDLETYKRGELLKVEQKAATMVGPAREQYLATERAKIEVLGTATTAAQRKAAQENATAGAVAAHTAQVTEQVTQLRLQTDAQERLAAAAGQGEAAQRRAAIENEVAAAAIRGMAAQTRSALEAQEAYTVALIRAEQTNPVERQIAQQQALAAAIAQGPVAQHAAELAAKAHALALREAKEGTDAFNAAFEHYLALLKRADGADFGVSLEKYGQQLADQRRRLGLDAALVGNPESVKAVAEAQHQVLEWLRSQGKEYDKLNDAEKRRIDNLLRVASENAEIANGIKRQEAAWKTVTDSLERAFDRVGDAVVEAFSKGEMKAVNWGNITRGVIASIVGDLLKMAVINPFRNMVFGTNSPTLFDLGGGGGGAAGAGTAGGSGNGLLGQATNWGMSKAAGWIGDKLGFGTSPGGVGMIDQFGMSMGFGAPTITSGALAAGYVAPTVTTAGGVVAASPAVQASQLAMLNSANAGTAGTLGATGGGMPALSGLLGSAGAGAFGGMLGGYLGTATNSKAIGGISGAALGAGSAWAMGAMMGSAAGPIGMAIGAIIGAIVGLVTTQKKSSNYAAATYVTDANGKLITQDSGADKTVKDKLPAIEQTVKAASDAVYAVTKAAGLTMTGNLWLGTKTENQEWGAQMGSWDGPTFSTSEDPAKIALDALKYMVLHGDAGWIPKLSGNADVITALKNSKGEDANAIIADLDFAAGFRNTLDQMKGSLSPVDNILKQMTDSAKQLGETVKTSITDWQAKAVELGLASSEELVPALKKGIEAMMGFGPETQPLIGMAAAVKGAEINFEAFRPALEKLGYTAAEISDLLTRYTQRARDAYNAAAGETIRRGNQSINAVLYPDTWIGSSDALRNIGLDPTKTPGLFGAFNSFYERARTGVVGKDDLRDMGERAAWRRNEGLWDDATYSNFIGLVTQIYQTATQKITDETAQTAAAVTEMQRSIFLDRLQHLSTEQQKTAQLRDQWQQMGETLGKYRSSLLVGDYSPLSPELRLAEAQRQYRDTLGKAQGGDLKAAGNLQSVADAYLKANKDYWASANPAAFAEVQDGLQSVETVAEKQTRIAADTLAEITRQTAILQQQLTALSGTKPTAIDKLLPSVADVVNNKSLYSTGADNLGRSLADMQGSLGITRGQYQAIYRLAGYAGGFGEGGGNAWLAADPANKLRVDTLLNYALSLPHFAAGGNHAGGLRLVGENGPEIEATGPSRIWNAQQIGAAITAANDASRWGSNVLPFRRRDPAPAAPVASMAGVESRLDTLAELTKAAVFENAELRRENRRQTAEIARLRADADERAARIPLTGTYAGR